MAAVRRGRSMRAVARAYGVSLATVQYWVQRAQGRRLDRVDWSDRPTAPLHTRRLASDLEDLIVQVRRELQRESDLGAFGAVAIQAALRERGVAPLPAVRTIGRVLERRGALDGRPRVRRPPPPRGWYLPDVAARVVELDSFDVVEGLVIRDGPSVEVLNGVSLHGGLPASWPHPAPVTAAAVVADLTAHWQAWGLPAYAQFDNDTTFQGPHQYPDTVGRVSRLCLALGIVPVFVPPREMGFQAMIESYNGWWQARVWARFTHPDLAALQERSARYLRALGQHRAARIEAAPARRPFPSGWRLNLQAHPQGRLIYLRRTDGQGQVEVLGHKVLAAGTWLNRLVRVEVDLTAGVLRCYALRRREPGTQPLLSAVAYHLPRRRFKE